MPRGRPRGSKNANTARQELERLAGESALGQGIDPLHVLEAIAAYFYGIAEAMRKTPDATLPLIATYFEKAARVAGMAAPYRHGKLSMTKVAGDPSIGQGPFKADATLEELKAELGKRMVAMIEAGVIDVASLPQPKPKVAN
jgi:hypothetical protein